MLERRDFLKIMSWAAAVGLFKNPLFANAVLESSESCSCSECAKDSTKDLYLQEDGSGCIDSSLKKQYINEPDIFLEEKLHRSFYSVVKKLTQVQNYVGFGNFNVISFDEAISIARFAKNIKKFTREELEFIEYMFYNNPNQHGFYGARTCQSLTDKIDKKNIQKVSYSGHFLFKDRNLETYNRMIKDVGNNIILTSGVRGVVKQTKLFLDKLNSTNLNLSEASNSIAPPAYSFHSVSDFDVGQKGLGYNNFTEKFTKTEVFQKLIELKYVDIRYTIDNHVGVRYEPWHIKVV